MFILTMSNDIVWVCQDEAEGSMVLINCMSVCRSKALYLPVIMSNYNSLLSSLFEPIIYLIYEEQDKNLKVDEIIFADLP